MTHPANRLDALMIYAAGFGTRMGSLTAVRPKPLIRVGGRALIDHALAQADGAGVARKAVKLHFRADQLAAHLAHRGDLELSVELPDIHETGGGLKQALPLLGPGPVMTLNSDAVWTGANALLQLRAAWDPARMDALLLLVPQAAARGHAGPGDFALAPDGRVARGGAFVYTGAQVLKTGALSAIAARVFSVWRLWDGMLDAGRLFGVVHNGGWCDVGHPGGIAEAEAMLAGG